MGKWPLIRDKIARLVGGLVMEKDEDGVFIISSGKLAFWATFIAAMFIWEVKKTDIPDTMYKMLVVFTSYNLGKKVLPVITAIFGKVSETTTNANTNTKTVTEVIDSKGVDNGTKGINQ